MSLIIPFSLLLLALLPPSFGIDYFDQQSRQQRVQSQANPQQPSPFQPLGSQQQQQRQPQPFGSGLQQTRNGFPQQPSPTGQLGLGFPQQQQQPTGIGSNPTFGAGIGQQRQQDQYEFGRQLQQQQQGRNSSSFGDGNPFQQQPGGIGGSLPDPNYRNSGNVLVEVSLHSYANSQFGLPNHLLCTCPRGNDHCVQASPQKIGYTCLTSLSVFVLSADSQLNFFETPYTPLNANGQLNFINQQQQQQQQQSSQFSHQFILDSPPSAIGILVYNLGAQIDQNGGIQETNTVTRVDTFIQSLNDTLPGSNSPFGGPGAGQQQANLRGQQGTELSFSYSFSCHGARGPNGKPLVGPGCDLSCNASSATGTTAMCVSQKTGYFSQCRWTAGNTQVSNCQHCPWGIKEDAYCADEQGGVLQPDHAGVVSSFYYKAFIALGVLCLILITCLILVCLLSLRNNVKSRRNGGGGYRAVSAPRNEAAAAGFTTTSTRVHRGEPEAAALNASAFKAPPPYSYRTNGEQPGVHSQTAAMSANPLPLPRSNASTASAESEMRSSSAAGGAGGGVGRRFPAILPPLVVAGKSGKMLSPPRYQPLPHLGAAAFAGTDSLNSSFAGNVPLAPPSVSADV